MKQAGSQSSVEAHAGAVDKKLAPFGLLILRVAIGTDWIVHALLKTFRGMNTHEALLARNGISPLLAWPTFTAELLLGTMIVIGFWSRQAAAFLLIFLAVVVWVKWPVGWLYSSPGGGWEYPMFWLFAQLAFVLGGDGAWALRRAPLIPR